MHNVGKLNAECISTIAHNIPASIRSECVSLVQMPEGGKDKHENCLYALYSIAPISPRLIILISNLPSSAAQLLGLGLAHQTGDFQVLICNASDLHFVPPQGLPCRKVIYLKPSPTVASSLIDEQQVAFPQKDCTIT